MNFNNLSNIQKLFILEGAIFLTYVLSAQKEPSKLVFFSAQDVVNQLSKKEWNEIEIFLKESLEALEKKEVTKNDNEYLN